MDVRGLLLVPLLLLAVPPAAAQEPDMALDRSTILYLHLNEIQDMPMNTQAPAETYRQDSSYGVATSTVTCFPAAPGTSFQQDWHTRRAFAFSGHMDYGERPPRQDFDAYGPTGLLADVALTGDRMTLFWYWSGDVHEPTGISDGLPVQPPVSGVVVEATLRAGQGLAIDPAAEWDDGELIAHGRTEPAMLAGEQSAGVTYSMVDGRHVYGFEVPMAIQRPLLTAAEGYNLRIDTYVLRDECPAEGSAMPNVLAAHSSLDHRPRLVLTADDAPRVDIVDAAPLRQGAADRIIVGANVTSPWGNSDVGQVELEIRSVEGGLEYASIFLAAAPTSVHCHCPPMPLQPVWLWDAGLDDAPAGRYVAIVTATSLQGATVLDVQEFTLQPDQEAPSLPAAGLLALLAVVAVALRRRTGLP